MTGRFAHAFALALLAAALPAAPASQDDGPDHVILKNGRRVDGRVVYEDDRELVLRRNARETRYQLKELQSFESVVRNLGELLRRLREVRPEDGPLQVLMLADWAAGSGLPGEARLLYYRVLELDPENRPAHIALGHREEDGVWRWPLDRKWFRRDDLFVERLDWRHAWEVSTTHYDIRSNAELEQIVTIALDLERFYAGFYRTFGELELREPWERLGVRLHADSRSYPEIGDDRPAYFVPAENRLYVNLATHSPSHSMFHEATHQLLYATAEQGPRARGEIPPWLGEGLAEFMATSVRKERGETFLDLGRPAFHHFREQVASTKPYRLGRVLQFGVGDFLASSHSQLKYAQCYTLVDFALQADGGEHRDGFMDFMEEVYRGRGSAKQFLRSLGLREDDCEERWKAHVEWMAQE